MIYTLTEKHEPTSQKLCALTRETMFSRYQNYEFDFLTHIPHYFNGISHNSAGWFLAVSENSRNFAPVIPEKEETGAKEKEQTKGEQTKGTENKKKGRTKEKKAYSCQKKQLYALYREISLKENQQAIGSMQCINDYCTILKRIRNERACSSQFVPSNTNLPIWAVERTCLPMHGQTS